MKVVQQKALELSDRAFELLENPDKHDVLLKPDDIDLRAEDFIAFANAENGGCILLGVKESTNEQGEMKGIVVGSLIDDKVKQSLIDISRECSPRVSIDIFEECLYEKLFLRIEIQSGQSKPYSTKFGRYVIHSNGIVRPLSPNEIRNLCMHDELNSSGQQILEVINSIEKEVYENKNDVENNFEKINIVLDALLDKMGIKDPFLNKKKDRIQSQGTVFLMEGTPLKEVIAGYEDLYPYLDKKLIKEWLSETQILLIS